MLCGRLRDSLKKQKEKQVQKIQMYKNRTVLRLYLLSDALGDARGKPNGICRGAARQDGFDKWLSSVRLILHLACLKSSNRDDFLNANTHVSGPLNLEPLRCQGAEEQEGDGGRGKQTQAGSGWHSDVTIRQRAQHMYWHRWLCTLCIQLFWIEKKKKNP